MTKIGLVGAICISSFLLAACGSGASGVEESSNSSQSSSPVSGGKEGIADSLKWIQSADKLMDCSEIFFAISQVTQMLPEANSPEGISTIRDAEANSNRFRNQAVASARIGGLSSEEYNNHVVQRGPQFSRYAGNPSQIQNEAVIISQNIAECRAIVDSSPDLSSVY